MDTNSRLSYLSLMPNLNAEFTDEEWEVMRAWKRRYAIRNDLDIDQVTWHQILLAFANSKANP